MRKDLQTLTLVLVIYAATMGAAITIITLLDQK